MVIKVFPRFVFIKEEGRLFMLGWINALFNNKKETSFWCCMHVLTLIEKTVLA